MMILRDYDRDKRIDPITFCCAICRRVVREWYGWDDELNRGELVECRLCFYHHILCVEEYRDRVNRKGLETS